MLGEKELHLRSATVELAHKDSSFLHHHARAVSPSTGRSASMVKDSRKGIWPHKEKLEAGRVPLLTCSCWAAGGRQEEG